jgi:hypothetical protein
LALTGNFVVKVVVVLNAVDVVTGTILVMWQFGTGYRIRKIGQTMIGNVTRVIMFMSASSVVMVQHVMILFLIIIFLILMVFMVMLFLVCAFVRTIGV